MRPERKPEMVKSLKSSFTAAGKLLFAFDLGNGYSKLRTVDRTVEFRSIYGKLSRRNTLINLADQLVIDLDGTQRYVFGDDVRLLCDSEPTALTSRIRYTSDMYRLFFASAFWKVFGHLAGEGILYPRGVLSIPVGEFNVQKDKEVRQLLQGDYAINGLNGATLHVQMQPQDLIIIPEGQGTFWDMAFAPDGTMLERYIKGSTAVVDIGYYTTDIVLLQEGIYVVGGAQSSDIGIGNVAAAVLEDLRRQGAYGLDIWQLDEMLSQPRLEINGQTYDTSISVHNELVTLTERIMNFANSTLRGKNIRNVILTGGGSQLVYPYLNKALLPNWLLAVNPRRGNVDGAFQFLARREKEGAKQ
jgi:hypothetical protein